MAVDHPVRLARPVSGHGRRGSEAPHGLAQGTIGVVVSEGRAQVGRRGRPGLSTHCHQRVIHRISVDWADGGSPASAVQRETASGTGAHGLGKPGPGSKRWETPPPPARRLQRQSRPVRSVRTSTSPVSSENARPGLRRARGGLRSEPPRPVLRARGAPRQSRPSRGMPAVTAPRVRDRRSSDRRAARMAMGHVQAMTRRLLTRGSLARCSGRHPRLIRLAAARKEVGPPPGRGRPCITLGFLSAELWCPKSRQWVGYHQQLRVGMVSSEKVVMLVILMAGFTARAASALPAEP